ncbi:DUF885 domain-containing protein [Candidatus Viadribacter manganicus]|uniref:DUF885 domain-containing protein n=1 Tax=Candidatus Viadribacter manganicus TaxID=1759059 RepID=A0A1B1AFF3_9PROT|nr:DUF885 domain-containing protein [Candidatus Viadribacter manganicus]ANP45287.1 hypothetical protein ATE48_04865 [Candidatus Viadribacter manganicus]
MKPIRWAFALALGLSLAVGACGPRQTQPMTAFEGKLADWAREILADSPETASQTGVQEDAAGGVYADRLDDRSAIAVEARRSAALRRYAELRALDVNALSPEDRLTYDVLRDQFANAAGGAQFAYGDFGPLSGARPYVLNQMDSAFITLPSFLDDRHAVTDTASAEAYLRRLRAVADAIDQETERARADGELGVRPPGFILDTVAGMLEGVLRDPPVSQIYITSFRRKLDEMAAREQNAERRAVIERDNQVLLARAEAIVREHVLPAHQRALAFVRSERGRASDAPGVSNLPRGNEFYAATLKIETTTELTPDQIHTIGRNRVNELNRELDIALRRLGLTEGPVGQRLAQLTADPRYQYEDSDAGRAQLINDVQARVNRVMERAPQWFGRLPQSPLEVRRVPVFAEAGSPGAYYNPPSLDGAQPGVYYINMRSLAEMTRIDLPTQDFHEAVPGHHFQIALAQELTDTPLLRRLVSFNAYSEGWALYAEELADEQGFHDGDPAGRIGYLRWQLWRAVRLVVDTGLHAKSWSRQQAIDYVAQTTGDLPGVIATEVDRYIVWPGQACGYELGRREIARLREEARNELGADFDLRGFHDAVLLSGEVPLSVLDTLVHNWIPEQRRLAERERRRR